MSAHPSRNNLLDVLPGFSAEEEVTGIHARPTISMPPFPAKPTAISDVVLALIAESEAEEKIEDVTDYVQVAQASLPPPPKAEKQFAAPPPAAAAETKKTGSRLARMAVSLTAIGFGIGFFFTSSPAPSSMTAESSPEAVSVPTVFVEPAPPAAEAPRAPAPAQPAPSPSVAKVAKAPTLADAEAAMRAGRLAAAEAAFQSVLAHGGADHEALTGLGNVAAAKHQTSDAMAFFERALARNPNYFPARLGLADVQWDAGRQDAAKAQYMEIRARYSPSVFPLRVLDRTR